RALETIFATHSVSSITIELFHSLCSCSQCNVCFLPNGDFFLRIHTVTPDYFRKATLSKWTSSVKWGFHQRSRKMRSNPDVFWNSFYSWTDFSKTHSVPRGDDCKHGWCLVIQTDTGTVRAALR